MKRKDFIRKIESAGWFRESTTGPHDKYRKQNRTFAVPRHSEISDGVARSWERINQELEEK